MIFFILCFKKSLLRFKEIVGKPYKGCVLNKRNISLILVNYPEKQKYMLIFIKINKRQTNLSKVTKRLFVYFSKPPFQTIFEPFCTL